MATFEPSRRSLPLTARRLARQLAGTRNNCPVELAVDPSQPPVREGESSGYVTMGGQPIRHPSAYSKRGWSNMRYIASTIRVTVGRSWLAEQAGI